MADKKPQAGQDVVVHEYDDIREYDNNLPNWWLWTLFGAIIFAAFYWAYYEAIKIGKGPYDQWKADTDAELAAHPKLPPITGEQLAALSKDAKMVELGKDTFTTNCVACHLATAGGSIGPNLTDAFWLHGGKPEQIYATVRDGFAAKGMPPWGPVLGEEKVRAAVAYVLTLRNTNVPGGKPAQGEEEK